MSFKDILVYVDNSPRSNATLAVAAELAQRFQAYLIGLHVIGWTLPTYDPTTYINRVPGFSLAAAIRDADQEMAQECQKQFDDQLQQSGIMGEWHQAEGMVAANVAREARYVDLTVVTQMDPANPPLGTRRYVPQQVLLSSGRPVLVVPHSGSANKLGDNILIGWNGSRESTRAVNDALPFLRQATAVTALTVNPQREYEGESEPVGDIVPHLARHGINAVNAQCLRQESGTGATLLDYAAKSGADLLVIGGYGHSRIRALILGGVSRGVLEHLTLPVLMSH